MIADTGVNDMAVPLPDSTCTSGLDDCVFNSTYSYQESTTAVPQDQFGEEVFVRVSQNQLSV